MRNTSCPPIVLYIVGFTSDVLGIVLYVEPLRTIRLARVGTEAPAREVPVREMVIADARLDLHSNLHIFYNAFPPIVLSYVYKLSNIFPCFIYVLV